MKFNFMGTAEDPRPIYWCPDCLAWRHYSIDLKCDYAICTCWECGNKFAVKSGECEAVFKCEIITVEEIKE